MAVVPESASGEVKSLGRYELLRPLARGGMAQLHLARFASIEGFEKLAVVKRLRAEHAERSDIVRMFLSEVRLLANMQHPNIVVVYDVGNEAGEYYFAMEFLHGQDVRAIIRKTDRNVPIEHALTIVTATLGGLHYVHERRDANGQPLGIVHRDVSPPNIFVTYDGNVKLLDFGIAKVESSQHTQAGVLKGKVRYMAPEQVNSEPVDRRSDVFAAGIVLWELTVGRRLFDGKTDVDVLLQISTQPITPPSAVRASYPANLERIVMKALARHPADRYATAREMQEDLEAYARDAKLTLSTNTLEKFMNEVFAADIASWHRAQREGKALSEHINAQLHERLSASVSGSVSALSSGSQSSQIVAPKRARRGRAPIVVAVVGAIVLLSTGVWLAATRTHNQAAPSASTDTPATTTAAIAAPPPVTAPPTAVAAAAPTPDATAAGAASAHVTSITHTTHTVAAIATAAKKIDAPPSDTKTAPTRPTWDKDSPLPPP